MQSAPAALRILNPVALLTGPDGLAAINTSELPDGAFIVVGSAAYQLRKTSAAATSSPEIVAPAAGPGRWFRNGTGVSYFQDVDLELPTISAGSGASVSVDVLGVANGNDIVVFNQKSDDLVDNNLYVTLRRISSLGIVTFNVENRGLSGYAGGTITLRVAVALSP